MKMLSNTGTRRLRKYGLLVAAAVMGVTAVTFSPISDVRAESGRRICAYSFKAKPRDYTDPLVLISIGLDYKKDGACPSVDPGRVVATGYVDADQLYPNPVEKWTCEDWGRTQQTHLTDLGADPCGQMLDDNLYVFLWEDPTIPNAKKPSYRDIGHWRVFS